MGFSYFYTMDANGAYTQQDIGHTGYEVGDVYVGVGKKIYIGGSEFVGGASGQINIVENTATAKKLISGVAQADGSIGYESYISTAFNYANPLVLTLGKSYTASDATIWLDQNCVVVDAMEAITGWTAGTNTPTIATNGTAGQRVEGTYSIKMTKTSLNGTADMYKTFAFSLIDSNFRAWAYPDTLSNVSKIFITLESSAGNNVKFNFLVAELSSATLNHLHCDLDVADGTYNNITKTTTGTFVRGSITKVTVGVVTTGAQTVNVSWDFMRVVDKWELVDALQTGFTIPIYDATNQADITLTAQSAYPSRGNYTLLASLANNYALGTFAGTAVFAKLYSGTISANAQARFDTAGSGAHAKTNDFTERLLMPRSVSGKKLYLSAQFFSEAFKIYDFPNTTSLRIYNSVTATDYTSRFKSGDSVVMFKLSNNYSGYQSYYNSTIGANFKILTLTTNSTFGTPYTTLTHANDTNATGGDTSDWLVVRLAVFLKYFVGTLTANEVYTTFTPTIFIPANINNNIFFFDPFTRANENPISTNGWTGSGGAVGQLSSNAMLLSCGSNSNSYAYRNTEGYTLSKAPVDIYCTFQQGNYGGGTNGWCGIIFGSNTPTTNAYDGIYLNFDLSTTYIRLGDSTGELVNTAGSLVQASTYCVRIYFDKYTVKAKWWLNTATEPATWNLTATRTAGLTIAGNYLKMIAFSNATYCGWNTIIDDVTIKTANNYIISGYVENQTGAKLCLRGQLTRQDTTNDDSFMARMGAILT